MRPITSPCMPRNRIPMAQPTLARARPTDGVSSARRPECCRHVCSAAPTQPVRLAPRRRSMGCSLPRYCRRFRPSDPGSRALRPVFVRRHDLPALARPNRVRVRHAPSCDRSWAGLRVLDVGTGRSTFPAWMSREGAAVTTFELGKPAERERRRFSRAGERIRRPGRVIGRSSARCAACRSPTRAWIRLHPCRSSSISTPIFPNGRSFPSTNSSGVWPRFSTK